MSNSVNPSTLLKVNELFEKKSWPIEENSQGGVSRFDRFIDRLQYFNNEGQSLFLDLSFEFEIFPMMEYLKLMKNSLLKIEDDLIKKVKRIFIVPLLAPFEYVNGEKIVNEKSKSSTFVHYMLEANDLSDIDFLRNAVFIKNIRQLANQALEDCAIIFVDDFIGSGETVVNVIRDYNEEIDSLDLIEDCKIYVTTIIAQLQGIDYLREKFPSVTVLADIVRGKGISDRYHGDDLKNKMSVMLEMERKSGCKSKYSFGHAKTEALVSLMDKTPNNTFPVFWHETVTKPAPFPRHHRFKGK